MGLDLPGKSVYIKSLNLSPEGFPLKFRDLCVTFC